MAIDSSLNRHRFRKFHLSLFCVLLVFLATGCGGGSPEQGSPEKTASASTDTGSASFSIQWHSASVELDSATDSGVVRQAIESCETAGVASITCSVYGDPSQDPIASGGPWDCSDHQGTIQGIPAGSNRTFAVLGWSGIDGGGDAIYQGQSTGVTINPRQTNDAGTIDARPFVPEAPATGGIYGNQIGLSWNDLGYGTYRIYRDGTAVGNSTSTTYSDTGLTQQTQYCYTISAVDGFGNESAQSGQTCATTTSLSIWYRDSDGDTYGDPGNSIQDNSTSPPAGYVSNNTDCNDELAAINPGADEICNGVDDNCAGGVDENLTRPTTCGLGACSSNTGTETCSAGAWGNDTCNPTAGASSEVCDNVDNDCDGSVDENLTQPTICGVGACTGNTGTETCSEGVWGDDTCNPLAGARSEVCDNVDNDCDGSVDESLTRSTTCGVGPCAGNTGFETCTAGNWGNDTCDPFAGAVDEVCFDDIDNDCSGVIDDDCVTANEDCIDFDPSIVIVYRASDLIWIVMEESNGNMQPLVFDDGDEAQQTLDTIQFYPMNSQCFVGPRDDPSMEYWLVNGGSPSGPFISDLYNEDCVPHDPEALYVRRQGQQWLLTDGTEAIKLFPTFELAQQALETILYYGFTYHCYVGRPDPPMSYWRR